MKLKTLGYLEIKEVAFSEKQPLLLLAFLALSPEQLRSHVASLFWPHKSTALQQKSLSEAIRKLKKVSPSLIHSSSKDFISSSISTDIADLKALYEQKDYTGVTAKYTAPFLGSTEFDKRIIIGEELEAWIINIRELVQTIVLEATVQSAQNLAFHSNFNEAAALVNRYLKLETDISYLTPEDYKNIYTLLLSSEQTKEANRIKAYAEEIYGHLGLPQSSYEAQLILIHQHTIPESSPHFIGRGNELTQLIHYLANTSTFITITGLGGIGKTELAINLAREARGKTFGKDGVYFVQLESIDTLSQPRSLVEKIALRLGMPILEAEFDVDQLVSFIAAKKILLIVDNFDYLIDSAYLLSELKSRCQQLSLIVTCREPLHLQQEQVLALKGLKLAKMPFQQGTLSTNIGLDARHLFELVANQYDIQLTQDDLVHVDEITHAIEGVPLALKLAAAWVTTLSCEQIKLALQNSFDLLSSGFNNLPERHQSIKASFDYSVRLLTQEENLFLTRLSIFNNGFTLEAASEIAGVSPVVLRKFVNKALVRFSKVEERFNFHPLIYEYLCSPEITTDLSQVRAKHTSYYLGGINLSQPFLYKEKANVRDAWEWAVKNKQIQLLFDATHPLESFYDHLGLYTECIDLLDLALLELQSEYDKVIANLLASKAWLQTRLSLYEEAIETAIKSLHFQKPESFGKAAQTAFQTIGACEDALGNYSNALSAFKEILKNVCSKAPVAANTHVSISLVLRKLGEYTQALDHLIDAECIWGTSKKQKSLLIANSRSLILIEMNKAFEALPILEEALLIARDMNFNHWVAVFLLRLGEANFQIEKLSQAQEYMHESIKLAEKSQALSILIDARALKAKILLKQKDFRVAEANLLLNLKESKNNLVRAVPQLFILCELYLLEDSEDLAYTISQFVSQENHKGYLTSIQKNQLKNLEESYWVLNDKNDKNKMKLKPGARIKTLSELLDYIFELTS